jgi:hypothetical protein
MENKQTELKYLYDKAIGDLVKCSLRIKELEAERDADRKREYGYSQQTVDALTAERDGYRNGQQQLQDLLAKQIDSNQRLAEQNKRLREELAQFKASSLNQALKEASHE